MTLWGDQDNAILKRWEWERIDLTAHSGRYWLLSKAVNIDPLYGEPIYDNTSSGGVDYRFQGPIELSFAIIYTEMDQKQWEAVEKGVMQMYDAECFISRLEWERANGEAGITREPEEGDVLYGMGMYWDVNKADRGGYVIDQKDWVGYKLQLKKIKKEDAARKVGMPEDDV